ncbi:MAG: hypothetical protein ACFB2W_13710 [Leptolyngbyaceae cyanobacterium]
MGFVKHSLAAVLGLLRQILALAGDDTQIIPGHGALSSRAELKGYRQLLVDVRVLTESAIASGQFLSSDPTASYDKAWG